MSDEEAAPRPSAAIYALITLRFLLELALWSSFAIACIRLIGGPLGWLVGLALTAGVTTVWAVLLSPRRPVQLPVATRVVIELALFVVAAALLAASGLTLAAIVLLALELLDLGLLHGPDKHAL